ncbi:MAG: SPOR domain-containing protein [Candidatus Electryonea clarkiae]|nr:SPOR domain-containing protein [Candidatus Electryonea clarkiae]MDP8286906.1 SPOR domain-containing protein [Candidatus Electryonea clarkiae]
MKTWQIFSKLKIIIIIIIASHLCNTNALSANKYEPVIRLAIEGRFDVIEQEVQNEKWAGTPQGDLALALIEKEGNEAFDLFERLLERKDASSDIKTVALFHLYGYYVLVSDYSLQLKTLEKLYENKVLTGKLFKSELPDLDALEAFIAEKKNDSLLSESSSATAWSKHISIPVSTSGPYSVQIGAFIERKRAENLVEDSKWTGDPVVLVPLKRGKKTLYGVWVGHFPDKDHADEYGRARFGDQPGLYKVVKRQ